MRPPLNAAGQPKRERLLFMGGWKSGKALSLDTPIPTPDGWTTMGELKRGDEVFDSYGKRTRVLSLSPIFLSNECYRIDFDGSDAIIADAEHLWVVQVRHTPRVEKGAEKRRVTFSQEVLTTRQMVERGLVMSRYYPRFRVLLARPLDLPDAKLPIDPYVLGLWLGDGTRGASSITMMDSDAKQIRSFVEASGYRMEQRQRKVSGVSRWLLTSPSWQSGHRGHSLRAELIRLGICDDKRIPAEYLRASTAQRLALLQGLMDTDGTSSRLKHGFCTFEVTDERFADGVYELVLSLGMKARRFKKPARLNGIEYGLVFIVAFRPTMNPFRLPRKARLVELASSEFPRSLQRYIRSIEKVDSVPVRCITVDAPDATYLCGESFIPTHNSHAWLTVALRHQKRDSDAVFYCIDTDYTCNELIGYPPFEDLENVVYEEPSDWESLTDTTRRFLSKIKEGDWLIVDMMTPCYEWSIQHVTQQVYGEDYDILLAREIAQQMTEKKLDSAAKVNIGQALLDIVPWKVVQKRYNPWATSLISHRGHVVMVSGQKEIYSREKGAAKEQFGGIGVKPDAQAYTGHLVNDVLWFRAPKPGEPPRVNTVGIGARGGRPLLDGAPVKDFALNVLVAKYGWRL